MNTTHSYAAKLVPSVVISAVLLFGATALRAQSVYPAATWGGGSGNWSNLANWSCVNGVGQPVYNCVPSAGFYADLNGGSLTLDQSATIDSTDGGSLTVPSTTLNVTGADGADFDTLAINSGTVNVTGGLSANEINVSSGSLSAGSILLSDTLTFDGGSVTSGYITGGTLSMNTGTLTIPPGFTDGFQNSATFGNVVIQNGNVNGTLYAGNPQITASQLTTLYGGGTLTISNSKVTTGGGLAATNGASTITGSTFTGVTLAASGGGSLDVNSSSFSMPSGDGSIDINGGAIKLEGGSTYQGARIVYVQGAAGSLTLDGASTSLTMSTIPDAQITIDGSNGGPPAITVQNGAKILDGGNTNVSLIVGLGFPAQLNITSGGQVTIPNYVAVTGGSITVSGAGSQLNGGANLTLDSGSIEVNSGGLVVGGTLDAGGSPGEPAANVIIAGSGSEMDVSTATFAPTTSSGGPNANLTVSSGGLFEDSGALYMNQGQLQVNSGATLDTSYLELIPYTGASVTGTIDGSGTVVNSQFAAIEGASLTIQNSAQLNAPGDTSCSGCQALIVDGTLNVQSGGVINSGDTDIGKVGTGVATITGAGSKLSISGDLTVGDSGTGTMNVSTEAVVTNHAAVLGSKAGSSGTVTVAGGETEWLTNGELTVGDAGNGNLTISNDALASSDSGIIAAQATSTSSHVTVTGGGSIWDMGADLTVGKAGSGTLSILDGGAVKDAATSTTAEAIIGSDTGSTGGVIVAGAGSTWSNGGDLTIGKDGSGSMSITSGGSVTNVDATIAEGEGSTSGVVVKDSGSLWSNSGDLTVGGSGNGTINIYNGGALEDNEGTVGDEDVGHGTVAMNDGTWTNNGSLTVGDKGVGTVTVENGGVLSSAEGSIGDSAGSAGSVSITDAGSAWNASGEITVGGAGGGSFAVGGGATVTSDGFTIGEQGTGIGTATVGSGSTLSDSSDLTVGESGQGTFEVQQGATASDTEGHMGKEIGSQGTATISGDWKNSGDLTVGDSGTGTLTIYGTVSNVDGDIASNLGAKGTVTVQGTGTSSPAATWYNSGSLKVGDGGTGELDVLDNGQVYSESGAIGGAAGSQGTVKVDGAGSLWAANEPGDTGNIEIGTDQGTGKLTVSDGGTVKANNIEVGANGTLDGVGGTLIASVTVDAGGTVSPGDPGPMNVTGNFDLSSGSTLTLEIASATDYDSLNITGDGTFDGTIDLDFLNGFAPSAGDDFDFITVGGAFAWSPGAIDFTGITPGTYTTDLTGGFGLTATSNWNGAPPSPSPEPGSLFLLATGLVVVGFALRRRKTSLVSGTPGGRFR